MSQRPSEPSRPRKRCFVTIGATAPFDRLLQAVLAPTFLQTLVDHKYTELRIQYGKEGHAVFDQYMKSQPSSSTLDITGFGFKTEGLAEDMRAAKGGVVETAEGAVISHAGSGSILEALRYGVPCIVVPNTDLLHNHQVELAEELARQQYVVHGKLDDLPRAIPEVEILRTRMQQWPPIHSGEDKYQKGLAGVMDEEMGWLD